MAREPLCTLAFQPFATTPACVQPGALVHPMPNLLATRRLSRHLVARAASGSALLLAALALLGSVTRIDWLVSLFIRQDMAIASTSLSCILLVACGISLKLQHRRGLATLAFAIALLTCVADLIERGLGLAAPAGALPAQLASTPFMLMPARMSLNLCVGVALLSMSGLLQCWLPGRQTAHISRLCAMAAATLGVFGVFGNALALDFLYHSLGLRQIAVFPGMLLLLLSLAIETSGVPVRKRYLADDFRLNQVTRTVVVVVAAVTGLASFAVTQRRLDTTLGQELNQRLSERAGFLATSLYDFRQRAELTTSASFVAQQVSQAASTSDAASKSALYTYIHELIPAGFSAIAYTDVNGALLVSLGQFHSQTGRSGVDLVPVSLTSSNDQLGWDSGYYLFSKRELHLNGQLVGYALSEQPVPSITRLTALADAMSSSTEVSLCSVASAHVICFPTSQHNRPFQLNPETDRVEAALIPRSRIEPNGMTRSVGRNGEPLLAAFRPVAGTSFVMIMTSDLSDVYAPVRIAFQHVLPLILLLAAVGILVVRWFVRPLVKQLLAMQRAAQESEKRFRAAAEGSLDALYLLEAVRDASNEVRDFRFTYANSHGERLLQVSGQALHYLSLSEAVPNLRKSGWFTRYLRVLESGQPITGNVVVHLPGMTGSWLHQHVAPLGDGIAVTVRDISAQKATEEKLRHAAQTDSLTGLPNRALLIDRIERALLRAVRQPNAIALLYVDLDGFKGINDHYGHAAGDAVLVEFARRLVKAVRAEDTVARLGGDEFCVLVENLSGRAEAFRIADALLLSARVPITTPNQTLRITASIGVAFGQNGEHSASQFLARADSALYQVKRRGRNGYLGEEAPEAPLPVAAPGPMERGAS
jgi:diguanylate cyclase (GGDEF)-like protein